MINAKYRAAVPRALSSAPCTARRTQLAGERRNLRCPLVRQQRRDHVDLQPRYPSQAIVCAGLCVDVTRPRACVPMGGPGRPCAALPADSGRGPHRRCQEHRKRRHQDASVSRRCVKGGAGSSDLAGRRTNYVPWPQARCRSHANRAPTATWISGSSRAYSSAILRSLQGEAQRERVCIVPSQWHARVKTCCVEQALERSGTRALTASTRGAQNYWRGRRCLRSVSGLPAPQRAGRVAGSQTAALCTPLLRALRSRSLIVRAAPGRSLALRRQAARCSDSSGTVRPQPRTSSPTHRAWMRSCRLRLWCTGNSGGPVWFQPTALAAAGKPCRCGTRERESM
jgi:hypothetical protein